MVGFNVSRALKSFLRSLIIFRRCENFSEHVFSECEVVGGVMLAKRKVFWAIWSPLTDVEQCLSFCGQTWFIFSYDSLINLNLLSTDAHFVAWHNLKHNAKVAKLKLHALLLILLHKEPEIVLAFLLRWQPTDQKVLVSEELLETTEFWLDPNSIDDGIAHFVGQP